MTDPLVDEILKPPVTARNKMIINDYLTYMREKLYCSLNSLASATPLAQSKQITGQLRHIERQLGVIDWLITVNQQRKESHEDSSTR